MQQRRVRDGLTVNVIAGSHVVFFGLDLDAARRIGCLGFAFQRTDTVEDETIWLRGLKTFEAVEPHPAPGETFSTLQHPVQAFQWADYGAKPGRKYRYRICTLTGTPPAPVIDTAMQLTVITEREPALDDDVSRWPVHSALFNRGSIATQEYARRFQNKAPNEAGPGAYEWLSRGLLEGLLHFIARAHAGWSLHGALYELQWPPVLDALRAAAERGADVRVLYDAIEAHRTDRRTGKRTPIGPWRANAAAVKAAGLERRCTGRRHGELMHNKFLVLSRDDVPVAVWTGSTNLTLNGLFGHSNVGHVVRDAGVARAFLAYWQRLRADPPVRRRADYRQSNVAASPTPPQPWKSKGTSVVFSPRGTDLDALDWYARIAASAERGLFMTFAFGMEQRFKDVFARSDPVLRMALLEKAWGNPRTRDEDERALRRLRARDNVVIALGNRIATNAFDRWLQERDRIAHSVHVQWVHTKTMLVDPLGRSPVVVTGSANFSKASTHTNDENMLVIRGHRRIAHVYFGEFIRLYAHYAFRESVQRFVDDVKAGRRDAEAWKPQYLEPDDRWIERHVADDGSGRNARRLYFSGN